MDLIEILKGNEGCELWSPVVGKCTLKSIDDEYVRPICIVPSNGKDDYYFLNSGRFHENGEVVLFPSEHQRNWSLFRKRAIESGTPVMVSNQGCEWCLCLYAKDKLCWEAFNKGTNVYEWVYIVPFADFDPYNLEDNKQKSI